MKLDHNMLREVREVVFDLQESLCREFKNFEYAECCLSKELIIISVRFPFSLLLLNRALNLETASQALYDLGRFSAAQGTGRLLTSQISRITHWCVQVQNKAVIHRKVYYGQVAPPMHREKEPNSFPFESSDRAQVRQSITVKCWLGLARNPRW
jgi:hypothetical protein